MSRNFYAGEDISTGSSEGPLLPDILHTEDVSTKTLPSGNQIYDSKALDSWFSGIRKYVTHKYHIYKTELDTQKSAAANEWKSAQDYVSQHVLTDNYERQELLVPAGVLALGAFFTGRVLTNRRNWGFDSPLNTSKAGILARNPSALGRMLTSIPSRMLLPWLLTGTVLSQVTPVTWNNGIKALEQNVLPADLVARYHELWNQYLVDGIQKASASVHRNVNASLQQNIGEVRHFLIKKLDL
ncbi:LAQU0S01e07932g1_1 [Lachancea quebecensis]|uniref:LAQU0S01e07932g1_1 n=1 Tax=Lachancea quebecensis TaxID=1654605 RepID=A0A0P1KPF8_9SACH|nr:LAQU0S01e07932g1_1 [Lachancea quebecensis]